MELSCRYWRVKAREKQLDEEKGVDKNFLLKLLIKIQMWYLTLLILVEQLKRIGEPLIYSSTVNLCKLGD